MYYKLVTEEKISVNYSGQSLLINTKYHPGGDTLVVFLHGLGCVKECFDAASSSVLANRFSILTFDFVGFGNSSHPDNFGYTLGDHAAIAKLVIDYSSHKSIVVVGHSMGGAVGILLSRLMNIKYFINVEGNLVDSDAGVASRSISEQSEEQFIAKGFDNFIANLKYTNRHDYKMWAKWSEKSSKYAYYKSAKSLVNWSDSGRLLEYFKELQRKSYIYGEKSIPLPVLSQLRDVKTYKISSSAHFMMLEQPDSFYSAVGDSVNSSHDH